MKSILGVQRRGEALKILDELQSLGYICYTLDPVTKKLEYGIRDWVLECSGEGCSDGAVYATDGYGFICLPRNITQRLADRKIKFGDADAWVDVWCHTVWRESSSAFSYMAPTVEIGSLGDSCENPGRPSLCTGCPAAAAASSSISSTPQARRSPSRITQRLCA